MNDHANRCDGITEAVCAHCGKKFCPSPYQSFKDRNKYFCKYTCMTAFQRARLDRLQFNDKEVKGSERPSADI